MIPDALIEFARRRARLDAEIRGTGAIPAPPPWRLQDPSATRRALANAYYAERIRVDETLADLRD